MQYDPLKNNNNNNPKTNKQTNKNKTKTKKLVGTNDSKMHRKCIRDTLCASSARIKREPEDEEEEEEEEQTNAAENRRATLQAVFADV